MLRPRRLALRLVTVAFGVALALAIGEIAVRCSGLHNEIRQSFQPGIYVADRELGWTLQPDYHGAHVGFDGVAATSTNPQGFRGPAWTPDRLNAPLRVLALGDSCTFGLGVGDDETWPSALESMLRAKACDAAVFNAGVPAFDTIQELALLRRVGAQVRPHVIVVAWLLNDVTQPSARVQRRFSVVHGQLMDDPNDYADWKHRVDHDGLYASALYRLWFESVKRLKYRFGHRRFDLGVVHVLEEHLKGTQEALLGIQQVGRELGARTLLLLVPQEDEVNDPSIDVAHHDLMAKFADEHGLDVVRVPQAWRAAAPIRGRYLERDPVHLNATGYRELAAAVASSPLLQEAAGKATSRN